MSGEVSSVSELSKLAFILGFRFLQRWDIHAIQLENGRYICEHKPVSIQHIFAHLKGEITLGAYLLDEKSLARYIVFDTDDQPGFSRLHRRPRRHATGCRL